MTLCSTAMFPLIGAIFCFVGVAQTAHYSGHQSVLSPVPYSGGQIEVAADGIGNAYLSDCVNNLVYKVTPSLVGSFTISTVPTTGLKGGCGIAADFTGNVYVADIAGTEVVKETLSGGSYTQSTVASGLNEPTAVAVDGWGNVFIADAGAGLVLRETPVANGYSQTTVASTSGNGLNFPRGLAVVGGSSLAQGGVLYIADTGNSRVLEEVPVQIPLTTNYIYSQTVLSLSGLLQPQGIATDASGDLYIADTGNNRVLFEKGSLSTFAQSTVQTYGLSEPSGVAVDLAGNVYIADQGNGRWVVESSLAGNFGTQNVGASSRIMPVYFTFDTAGTLGSVSVLTQGTTGLDFKAGTGSTCAAGTAYTVGHICQVNVTFSPKFSGTRYGGVVLENSSGSTIANGYVHGTGVGPQADFETLAQSVYAPGEYIYLGAALFEPEGLAVDGSGNVFLGTHEGVMVIPPSGPYAAGYFLLSQFPISYGVALDGVGNLFVAEPGNNAIQEIVAAGGLTATGGYSTVKTLGSGFAYPDGVAVDGSGNVFVADTYNNAVKEIWEAGGYSTVVTLATGFDHPEGIAVDGAGNVFVADTYNNAVKEIAAVGVAVTTLGSGFNAPDAVAVDGRGNVFVADNGNSVVKEIVAVNGIIPASPTINTLTPGYYAATGLAVDGRGNVYVADFYSTWVSELDFADPPSLSFAATKVGSTSRDSPQTVVVENIGNATLDFPVPATGSNPSIAANFSLSSSAASACPVVNAGASSAGTLAAGESCALAIGFLPTTAGSITGSLVLTNNTLNASSPGYASQTIQLSGSGDKVSIAWSAPAPIFYGTNLYYVLNAVALSGGVTVPGTFAYTATAAGQQPVTVTTATILTVGAYTLTATFTPADTTDFLTTTATVSLTVNPATPAIDWATPVPIRYGTQLGEAQLNAVSAVAGAFVYSPAAGVVLPLGVNVLSVTFTPADTLDYLTATASVTLVVTPFGTIDIGAASPPALLSFTFANAATLGSINVVTQGVAGMDFTNAGTGTCTVGISYAAGATCSVAVVFVPRFAGFRYGAAVLEDASGNVLGSHYLAGAGSGPQINYWPGRENLPGNGMLTPNAVAADGNGDMYIADSGNNRILKETLSSGVLTQSVVPSSTLSNPQGVAVDGGGNIYIADFGNNRVLKETLSGSAYIESTVVSGVPKPMAVAVDGSGGVYILTSYASESQPQQIVKETPNAGSYSASPVYSGSYYLTGIAVDGNGNVYFSETLEDDMPGSGGVFMLTPSKTGYTLNTVDNTLNAVAVSVDGNGNVYTIDSYTFNPWTAIEETPFMGVYVQIWLPISAGLIGPTGVSVDGIGNVYLADPSSNLVLKQDYGDPTQLSFAATNVGSTSSDSPQTVTVLNVGNDLLTFSAVSFPATFPEDGSGWSDCTANMFLPPNGNCTLTIDFLPTAPGPQLGYVVLTDNALNVSAATQGIALAGTGIPPSPAVITSQPISRAVSVGSTATFSVTVLGQPTLTYVWQYLSGSVWMPFTQGSGYNTATLTTAPAIEAFNGMQFRVVVTDGSGKTTTSNTATLSVGPAITTQPASQSVRVGSTATFTVVANGAPTLDYVWQYQNGSNWNSFGAGTGYNTPTLTTFATTEAYNGLRLRVVVTDGLGMSAVSNTVTLLVGPEITGQPGSLTVPLGSSATFNVEAMGTPVLTYAWQYLSGTTWKPFGAGTGYTTNTMTTFATTAAYNGLEFRVVVTDGNGLSATSNNVKLTVAPVITTQPTSQTVADGSTATFTVVAAGVPTLTYQWQYLSGTTWKAFGAGTGYNTATLTTLATTAAYNGLQFRVVVTDGNGLATTSSTVKLTVAPAIVTQPASQTVAVGSTATFTVVAAGVPAFTYQWQYLSGASWKAFGAGTGYTSATLITFATTAAYNGLQLRVVVTDGDGLIATSNTAVLTVQ